MALSLKTKILKTYENITIQTSTESRDTAIEKDAIRFRLPHEPTTTHH